MDVARSYDNTRAYRFLENVLTTEEHELDCHAVMAVIARYVEVEVTGETPLTVEPGVPQHLRNCALCAEMYETLKQLVILEATGELPDVDELWGDLHAAIDGSAPDVCGHAETADAVTASQELQQASGLSSLVVRIQRYFTASD